MDRIQGEAFGLGVPAFADVLIGREAFEGLQSSPEVVGADEVGQMPFKLVVVVVVEPLDGGVRDRAVHAFDPAVCPRGVRFGRAVLDAQGRTVVFEGVRPDGFALGEGLGNQVCCRSTGTGCGEMGAAAIGLEPMAHQRRLGQDDVDPVRHGFNKMPEEITRGFAKRFAMKLDEGEFARPINGNEQMEPAFRRLRFGNIDVEKADGIALERLLRGPIAFDIRKPRNSVALKAPMQRRPWSFSRAGSSERHSFDAGVFKVVGNRFFPLTLRSSLLISLYNFPMTDSKKSENPPKAWETYQTY